MANKVILEVENLTKYFNTPGGLLHAVDGVNFKVEEGRTLGIVGESGCGKSTTGRTILKLLEPTSGKIIFDGQDITNVPMEKRGFNIVFQDYALFPNLNVMQNITYGLKNTPNISTQEGDCCTQVITLSVEGQPVNMILSDDTFVVDTMALVQLSGYGKRMPAELSGGQRQRVAIARAVVNRPSVLLLDEPLSALDGVIKESIKEKIKQIARDYHLTTIIVTHDPEEALTLSDKVLIVNDGSISQYGAPEEIITTPQNAFIKEFILNQLEIKRNNIFALFHQEIMAQAV